MADTEEARSRDIRVFLGDRSFEDWKAEFDREGYGMHPSRTLNR